MEAPTETGVPIHLVPALVLTTTAGSLTAEATSNPAVLANEHAADVGVAFTHPLLAPLHPGAAQHLTEPSVVLAVAAAKLLLCRFERSAARGATILIDAILPATNVAATAVAASSLAVLTLGVTAPALLRPLATEELEPLARGSTLRDGVLAALPHGKVAPPLVLEASQVRGL